VFRCCKSGKPKAESRRKQLGMSAFGFRFLIETFAEDLCNKSVCSSCTDPNLLKTLWNLLHSLFPLPAFSECSLLGALHCPGRIVCSIFAKAILSMT